MNEISNDKEFISPKPLKSFNSSSAKYEESQFPTDLEILNIIHKCKMSATKVAENVGMIKKNEKLEDSVFSCQVPPYTFKKKRVECDDNDSTSEGDFEDVFDLEMHLMSSSLKNYSGKVTEDKVTETSPYVEMYSGDRRLVYKKTSLCWLFAKESYKSSSDRIYRVREPSKPKRQRKAKTNRHRGQKTKIVYSV